MPPVSSCCATPSMIWTARNALPPAASSNSLDARIEVGAEAIPRDIGYGRVGQRAQSDVFHFNTIGGADGKTDVVGSAGQHPHDGDADEPRDQRPQGISADAIRPLHVVDGEQQALPISQPSEMACDTVDEQQRLGGQRC